MKLLMWAFLFLLAMNASAMSLRLHYFQVQGISSLYGPYQGELEIRSTGNKLTVTKIFTYQQFKFDELSVQEVWTGEATSLGKQLILNYSIRQADIFNSAEGHNRSPDMFHQNIPVSQILSPDLMPSVTFNRGTEQFQEHLVKTQKEDTQPLWQDLRTQHTSYGKENSRLVKVVQQLLEQKVFKWFHADPKVRAYEDREEFKSKNQYFIFDPTDFEFYQKNKSILRVVNKIPDTISLIEDIQRRNAYAFDLDAKARHFEEVMTKYHVSELGQFSTARFDHRGNFQKHEMVGDGALWTGMYLASEAMRYKVTQDNAALANVKKTLKGLMLLMDITGDEEIFARNAAYDDGSVELGDKYRRGAGIHQDKIWRVQGNNDMFKGLIHGFIWSYFVLPKSEAQLKNELLAHMKRITKLKIAQEKSNLAPSFGLRALATKSKKDKEKFIKHYILANTGLELTNLEGTIHLGGIADWSGVNLKMVTTITNILIAKAIMHDFPAAADFFNKDEKDVYRNAMKDLVILWKDMIGTRRDLLTIAAYNFAIKEGLKLKDALENRDGYTEESLHKAWNKELANSIWGLREIPLHRSKYDINFDNSLRAKWSLSWWPKLPWKSFNQRQSVEYHMQGAYAYPLFESKGIGSNFIWKDQPFAIEGSTQKTRKDPPADYLYTYWLARLSGLVPQ